MLNKIFIIDSLKKLKFLIEDLEIIDKERKKNDTKSFFVSTKYLINLNDLHQFESMEPSKLFAKNIFVDYCLNTSQEDHLFLLVTLRDKSFQMFREYSMEFEDHHGRALRLGNKKYDYTQEFVQVLREKDLALLFKHAELLTQLLKILPGFDQICYQDQMTLIKESFFTTLAVKTLKIFVDGECYLMLDDYTQLDKEGLGILMSESVRDMIFEFSMKLKSLNVTDQELSVLVPFFISWNCGC